MTAFRLPAAFARQCLFLTVASTAAIVANGASASAQAVCNPACGPGQLCIQGTCMVPAAPTVAPPPAYPPPPAQYQQAAPVDAQGYPAPQGNTYPPAPQGNAYPAPPPQGAYPPPQGAYYPPQPGGAYPPPVGAYPPPPPPPQGLSQRRGFLALPFLGIHSFQGKTGEGLDAGLRLGVLLGGHINEMFSANGELTIDALNLKNIPSGTDASAVDVVIAFSPLAHLPFGNAEFVFGPKLGIRSGTTRLTTAGDETSSRVTGYVIGLNAGAFAAVTNSMSLGGLFSAEVRSAHQYCVTLPGQSESCSTDSADTGDADKVIGLTAAALF